MIEGCLVIVPFMLYKKIGILILSYRFWFKQLFENRGPMKTTKSFGEYPKYSLHDARVQKIELNYLSISRIIVKVSSRSLQRLITGAEQYSKGGYGPKGIPYIV